MKIINRFILASYFRPLIRSFLIALFILVMMFIARYKDDLLGKGLETFVIVKIFFFASVAQMIFALPVSILLSSLFTMGNFGENYELAAMRSSGLALRKILRPMVAATIVLTFISFGFSSYVVPWSNLKLYSLLYDVQQMKPAFTLKPGHFNSAIDNYVIRIEGKDVSRDMLYNVLIYDHTSGRGNQRFVFADSGIMRKDPYGTYMNMTLFDGVSYEVTEEQRGKFDLVEGFVRLYYDTLFYRFDLEGFALERTEEEAFSSHQYMLNLGELQDAVDSIEVVKQEVLDVYAVELTKSTRVDTAFLALKPYEGKNAPGSILAQFPKNKRRRIMDRALDNSRKIRNLTSKAVSIIEGENKSQRERLIELHMKYSLPMACMVFLFIGAPFGAIIRKGGAGIPIIISIVFYLTFNVLMIQGKKMAVESVLPVWVGVWLPVLVMLPLALFLTYDASSSSKLLSVSTLWKIWRLLLRLLLYLNPLYYLWKIPAFQRVTIRVLGPVVRRLFPKREEGRPTFRVRR
ncbi:MAG: LptF/LptG family permease [Bacteroidota bacterium]